MPDTATPTTRQRLLAMFRHLKKMITLTDSFFDGLYCDPAWEGFGLYGVADKGEFKAILRLAIGTTCPDDLCKDWPEDKPWVELWLYCHEDGRLTIFRSEDGDLFKILWTEKGDREGFTTGLDPWMDQVRADSTAWQRVLEKPDSPITMAQLAEMTIAYLRHYDESAESEDED
ncbi:hypothetical protein HYS28_01720 [Candidatus Uhrbacteria bacterium]|nr:hypothetical protein [Candidatus Uhrbacteria bacterium]